MPRRNRNGRNGRSPNIDMPGGPRASGIEVTASVTGRLPVHDPDLDPVDEANRRRPSDDEVRRTGYPFRSTEELHDEQINAYSNFQGGFEFDMKHVLGIGSRSFKDILRPGRPRDTSAKTVSRGRAQ